jgi:hypothetical protein
MNATGFSRFRVAEPEQLPDDLRVWLDDTELSEIATEAVRFVTSSGSISCPVGFPRQSAESVFALLVYSFAVHYCGTEEVQWAAETDATVRRFHPPACLEPAAIRQFRTRNREHIQTALVYVMHGAIDRRLAGPSEDATPPASHADICQWANHKLALANLLDAAASD